MVCPLKLDLAVELDTTNALSCVRRKHLFIGITVAGAVHMIYKIAKFIQFLLEENKELQRRKAMTAAHKEE